MIGTKAYCRSCGNFFYIVLRTSRWVKTWIKHHRTGEDVFVFKKQKATSQKYASVTGVPCPRCKKHKLARA